MGVFVYLCLFICAWYRYLTDCLPVHVTTPPSHTYQPLSSYGIHIRGRYWLTFQVKTRHNALIGLQTFYNSTNFMYEIVLGGRGNNQSSIRKGYGMSDEVNVLGSPLSDQEYRHFWVSWTGANITVGRGSHLGSDVIMFWRDPTPMDVNYLAVSGYNGAEGEWIFENFACIQQLKFAILDNNAICNHSDARMITANDVTSSRADCSIRCFSKPWCRGFSYGASGSQCNMFDVASSIEESEGWETWSLVP